MSVVALESDRYFLSEVWGKLGKSGAQSSRVVNDLEDAGFVRSETWQSGDDEGRRLLHPTAEFWVAAYDLGKRVLAELDDAKMLVLVSGIQAAADTLPQGRVDRGGGEAAVQYYGSARVLGSAIDPSDYTEGWMTGEYGWQLLLDLYAAERLNFADQVGMTAPQFDPASEQLRFVLTS